MANSNISMKLTIRKTLLLSLGIFLLLGVAALAVTFFRVNRTVVVDGEFTYRESLPLTVRESGFVEQIVSSDNEWVDEGDTLIILSNPDLEREFAAAKQRLDSTAIQLAELERQKEEILFQTRQDKLLLEKLVNIRHAETVYIDEQHSMKKRLFESGSLTSEQLSASQLALKKAENAEAEARIRLESIAHSLQSMENGPDAGIILKKVELEQTDRTVKYLRERLELLALAAPASGMLISNSWDGLANSFLRAGDTIGDVVSFEDINFTGFAKDTDIIRIDEGQLAYFDVEVFRRKVFVNGVVAEIGYQAISGPGGLKLFPVEIELANKMFVDRGNEFYIQAGVKGQAVIIVEERLSLISMVWEKILDFADFGVYTE